MFTAGETCLAAHMNTYYHKTELYLQRCEVVKYEQYTGGGDCSSHTVTHDPHPSPFISHFLVARN